MEALYVSTLIIVSLALIATVLSHLLKISIALVEITIGILGGYAVHVWFPHYQLDINSAWFTMLASTGALMLTFLAGSELDHSVLKREWKSSGLIGIAGFLTPFLGCGIAAYYGFGWSIQASLLTGLVLSTTSVALVYGTLLELGMNEMAYSKSLLTACFVIDFCTVISLGLIFSPFSFKTVLFFIVTILVCAFLPSFCKSAFKIFGKRPSAFEIKFILFFLLALGLAAVWSGYEPVLPAFFVGIALAGIVGKDHELIKHLQSITFGLLTPFYFIRAGFLVSVPTLISAIIPIIILLLLKVGYKGLGIYFMNKTIKCYRKNELGFTILLMSTGLAFGSIAALFGLTHGIIDQKTYSLLITVVVASAVIPTIIATAWFLPQGLLKSKS